MGVLARVLEEAGIATVGLSLVRGQAEKVKAPRFLHCDFPLGRPLGRPNDREFQHDVIRRAFALLDRSDVPVLEDHPVVIEDEVEQAAVCVVPPRHDPDLHPAVDEAMALRPAWERQLAGAGGRTAVGRMAGADGIAELVATFVELAASGDLDAVGLDADGVRAAGQDVRAYYEEAALALADHVPAARQIETWFYQSTETGPVIRAAAKALEAAGEERGTWYYLLPGAQQH